MTSIDALYHRELVDRQTRLERIELVKALIDGLKIDPAFVNDGDVKRRKAAKRMAFTMHRLNVLNGWHDTLRNRRHGRG